MIEKKCENCMYNCIVGTSLYEIGVKTRMCEWEMCKKRTDFKPNFVPHESIVRQYEREKIRQHIIDKIDKLNKEISKLANTESKPLIPVVALISKHDMLVEIREYLEKEN